MRPVNRAVPLMPAQAYKTYQVARPLPTHWRQATCAEVDCPAYLHGWKTVIDVAADLGARQANYIRLHSGRAYVASETGTVVTFTFPAGQRCFGRHQLPVDRDPLFAVTDGDWRGNPYDTSPRMLRPQDWVSDFGEHQERLADRVKRG